MNKKVKLFELADKKFINVAKGKNLPKNYRDKGDFPVIAAGKSIAYFSSHANYNTNTITISSSGANAGFVWKHTYPIWASDCTVIEVNENINLDYFYLFLLSKQEIIYSFQTGAGQPHVYWKDIKNIEIDLPSLEKQKQIAKTLDKANELIELRKESITKLDALAKSIFIDMFGDPVSNPRGWEVKELNDICEITSSKRVYKSDYVSEGIPFYKIKEIILKSKNIEPEEIEYISKDAFENFASKFGYPQKGDILVTAVGATIGYFYLVDDEKFYFKDGNLIWLRNYKIDINKKFLLYMFQTKEFKNKILGLSKGAAQDALTIIKLKSVFICMPPIDIQNKFAKIIEKIEEQKSLYEKELKKLEENFQALLQKSFQE
ncbi:restriction endonuclease subunit S [Arcobacter cloacae]|uniref:Uncharacterized protein n=1 Tax=Arcobacter cloacae TaxID=1054034 RepID=A0A6M8NSD5_9BACT|nr:restriction endonuclease subunit S [Arcobacter cloacae]QKF90714.1 type I restriction/modification system, specificity subunit [Arcobacter cloacae]RXI41495.1 hypothetical protein CP963_06920 [Arcobacter cloacae]